MTPGAKVLDVLAQVIADYEFRERRHMDILRRVRNDVAELIAADVACDAAYVANDEDAFKVAAARRTVALARIQGGAA